MKLIYPLFIFYFLWHTTYAQPGFVWAKQIGGTSPYVNIGGSITTDRNGNVYTTGCFGGTTDFDPGPGVYNLTAAGWYDIFVSKMDSSGNFIWAKSMGGPASDFDIGYAIAVDSSGSVYTTGIFNGIADFDPGTGVYDLTANSTSTLFISKLDPSGNFVWAVHFPSTPSCTGTYCSTAGYGIAIDKSNNVITTGYFYGTVDFDPGIGTYNLNSADGLVFIYKLNSAGNFVWAKQIDGENGFENSIAVDLQGNIYTTGCYDGSMADFDPGTGVYNLTSSGFTDIYVNKLDSNGNFIWAKSMGGSYYDSGNSIAVDNNYNVYVAGHFHLTADFDPGINTFTMSAGPQYADAFVCKLNSLGSFVWAKQMGGSDDDGAWSMIINEKEITVAGTYNDTADFDPGTGVFNLISQINSKVFVDKLDTSGNFLCAGNLGGNYIGSLAASQTDAFYATGYFSDSVDFDPGPGIYNLSTSNSDAFISKLNSCSLISSDREIPGKTEVAVYPNPTTGLLTVSLTRNAFGAKIYVYDLLGNCICKKDLQNEITTVIDLGAQAKGIYILETSSKDQIFRKKIIIQ